MSYKKKTYKNLPLFPVHNMYSPTIFPSEYDTPKLRDLELHVIPPLCYDFSFFVTGSTAGFLRLLKYLIKIYV